MPNHSFLSLVHFYLLILFSATLLLLRAAAFSFQSKGSMTASIKEWAVLSLFHITEYACLWNDLKRDQERGKWQGRAKSMKMTLSVNCRGKTQLFSCQPRCDSVKLRYHNADGRWYTPCVTHIWNSDSSHSSEERYSTVFVGSWSIPENPQVSHKSWRKS